MERISINNITQEKLQKLAVPTVTLKAHQAHLKQALFAATIPAPKTTKSRWSNLMTKKKLIVSGSAVMFAALAIVVISVVTGLSPVSAAQLTQQSLDKVAQLSPSQEQQLEMRVNANPKAALQAAKNAKDLQILTYAQFKQMTGQASTISIHAPDGGSSGPVSLNPSSLQYLRYTGDDGATHIIGVDKTGLPVLIMMFRQNSDGSSEGSVQVTNGDDGGITTGVSGSTTDGPEGVSPTGATGMVTCNASSGGKPTCTNSDGSSAPTPHCQSSSDGTMTCSASASETTETTKP